MGPNILYPRKENFHDLVGLRVDLSGAMSEGRGAQDSHSFTKAGRPWATCSDGDAPATTRKSPPKLSAFLHLSQGGGIIPCSWTGKQVWLTSVGGFSMEEQP